VVFQIGGVTGLFLVLTRLVGPGLRAVWRRQQRPGANGGLSAGFLALLLVALCASALATQTLGVFSIFGAFLLGVALHEERGLVQAWRESAADFVLVALVPIFFTYTGLRTQIGSLSSLVGWIGCATVLAAAVAGKLGGCFLGARFTGQTARESACIAALMNTRGLMGLVAINVGADLGLLPPDVFTMFVIMALATTAMTSPLLRRWLPPSGCSEPSRTSLLPTSRTPQAAGTD
jgi:Kef-type K+ transport system membrane component KefB